ncbi:MAG TPA: helix-turn-helix domain-containing protein [Caulobacteraceae bacterium]
MSTKSAFLEQLGPRVRIRAVDRVRSGSRARLNLNPGPDFKATVSLARSLMRRGVKASVARDVAERLAAGHAAPVTAPLFDGEAFIEELRRIGVGASPPKPADGGALAALRKQLKLSQEQFANSVGLEVRTLQNWEQKRGSFDAPTALLIKVIEQAPEIVQRIAADEPAAKGSYRSSKARRSATD